MEQGVNKVNQKGLLYNPILNVQEEVDMFTNNVRTLVTMVVCFVFLVAATPPSCSTNSTISYTDNGIVKTVKLSDLRAWATTEIQNSGNALWASKSSLNAYATTSSVSNTYLTKSESTTLATKQQLLDYISKTQLSNALSTYAKTGDLVSLEAKTKVNLMAKVDKEELTGLKAIMSSVVSALGLNQAIESVKGFFTSELNKSKNDANGKFASKEAFEAWVAEQTVAQSEVQAQIQAISEIEPVVETSSGVEAYNYEPDPNYNPDGYWYVQVTSKSQPTYTIVNPQDNADWVYFASQVQGAIDVIRPDLPAVNNTGKVNITLARNQVNGITLGGTMYQAVIGLVELLKHGYDDNYFGVVKLTDGRYFLGKRNGNSVEVIYVNDESVEGAYISEFYSRVDCIQFTSDM